MSRTIISIDSDDDFPALLAEEGLEPYQLAFPELQTECVESESEVTLQLLLVQLFRV